MGLERCRPLELHGKVHQAPVALFVELARVREPYVRNTSRAARRRHSRAVNYRVHVSKAHMPDRNHLDALRALQESAVRPCRFRWAIRKQWPLSYRLRARVCSPRFSQIRDTPNSSSPSCPRFSASLSKERIRLDSAASPLKSIWLWLSTGTSRSGGPPRKKSK